MTKGNKTFAAAFSNSSFMPAKAINAVFMFDSSSPVYPDGALTHKFTVDENGTQVWFAHGNLYWDGESFNLEKDQFSYATGWNASHVSHFFWSEKEEEAYQYAYDFDKPKGTFDDVLFTNVPGFTVNGQTDVWRSLSTDEWIYLLKHHKTKMTFVGPFFGLSIAPDGFEGTLAQKYDFTLWEEAEKRELSSWQLADTVSIKFSSIRMIRVNIGHRPSVKKICYMREDYSLQTRFTVRTMMKGVASPSASVSFPIAGPLMVYASRPPKM